MAFVTYDFNDPNSPAVWRQSLPILARAGAPLWVIVKNAPSQPALRDLLQDMASRSRLVGVRTVIYPHWNTSIETAAQAATLMAQVAHPNLKNSLHTCHEIRGGHQYTPTLQTSFANRAEAALLGCFRPMFRRVPGSLLWCDSVADSLHGFQGRSVPQGASWGRLA